MKSLLSWFHGSRWIFWVLLSGVVGFAMFVLGGFVPRRKPGNDPGTADPLPPEPGLLRQKVAQAEEDSLRARVEARARADADKAELDRIRGLGDGAERRKRLAEMLRRS